MRSTLAIAALVACATVNGQTIYRCTDKSGAVTMQDTACSSGTEKILNPRPERAPLYAKPTTGATVSDDLSEGRKRFETEIERYKRERAARVGETCSGDRKNMAPTIGVDLETFRLCRADGFAPQSVRTTTSAYGTTEFWHLAGGGVLMFQRGKLVSMSF